MSASVRASFTPAATAARSSLAPLGIVLGIGLVLRLLFVFSTGFDNDVQAFESWTLTLRDNAPWLFYAKAGFADYPPGYFVVLWLIGRLYALIPGVAGDPMHGYVVLRVLIKLPAIAMDLVNAYVVYRIARRYAAEKTALLAAALLALNPAAIYVSSYWGQVDSVSWGLSLIALWQVLRAGDEPAKTVPRLVSAWIALAFSVLIKPQGATLALLLLAYPFATSEAAVRARRAIGTVYGVVASFVVAAVVGLLFHPAADVFGWLFGRYTFGSAVYKYTSVNAFNLYALRLPFWREDNQVITLFGFPAGTFAVWGVALVVAATLLIVGRYLQRRDDRALLEGAMLCALAFFVLATRMHERYVYGAFLLAMPLVAFGRAGLWSSLVLTVTMYLNLAYSFAYQTAMRSQTPGVDTTDLWPLISHPAALANVVLFFWCGYQYLGGAENAAEAKTPWIERTFAAVFAKARTWFDPREGLIAMDRRDWMFAGGFVVLAFLVAIVNLAWPPEKIFDEVYFPRSAAEYLRHVPQYEWTHPPGVKLLIAVSIAMFGDHSFGWRFLNVVVGAVEVGLLYVFAKRLVGSTLFAALAAFMMTFDGFHFAEQRIATGEITIATLILLVLYALYRFVLSSQVAIAAPIRREPVLVALRTLAAIPVAAAFSWVANLQPPVHPPTAMIANGIFNTTGPDATSYAVAFAYAMCGLYLLVRFLVRRYGTKTETVVSYADGAYVESVRGAKLPSTHVPAGGGGGEPVRRKMQPDGRYEYTTPVATARFTPDGTMTVGELRTEARTAKIWLAVLVVALGLLISCKWNGFYDLALVMVVLTAIAVQRLSRAGALWGNPRGFPLDVTLGLAIFVPATIYALSYIPTFLLGTGHSLADIIALQHQMFWYHTSLSDQTHPYRSVWWQWPIMQIPIVYYYHDFRPGGAMAPPTACCVAEIMALPNPFVFLLGLISVPFTGWLAWHEKNKGYAILVLAYFMQWLPWIRAPRELWEYHFFPNFAVIVLCDIVLIAWLCRRYAQNANTNRVLAAYAVAVFVSFVFFYPVLAGTQISYDAWYARMLPDVWHIPHTSWVMPQR
jgi:Gpi18-like mannosyltransferase